MVPKRPHEPRSPYAEDAHWVELIRRAKRSSEKEFAYENLLKKHWQGVTVLALGRVGELREAEDVAQETFERAFRSLDKLKEPTAFLGWLLRIASNVATDHIRSRKPVVSLDTLGESIAPESQRGKSAREPEFQRLVEQDDEIAVVIDALGELPDRYREVITLKYLRDMDGRAMAEQLGEPEGTVRNRLFRALEKLRGVLASHGRPPGDGNSKTGDSKTSDSKTSNSKTSDSKTDNPRTSESSHSERKPDRRRGSRLVV